ncbi:MAG: SRPBCC domain-containing protein [Chloroflexi bacterium]|nr:SRPBCC domain-containing protein [Chloroflexota bacterium]
MNYKGKIEIDAAALDVWEFVLDVDKFASCMPGVEDLVRVDDKTFTGKMRAKVGPISGEFVFEAQIVDAEAPVKLTAHVEGKDTLTNSTMTSDIEMNLASEGDTKTELTYSATVDVQGRLAIIGDMVLRATGAQVIKEFFKRLRNQITGEAA